MVHHSSCMIHHSSFILHHSFLIHRSSFIIHHSSIIFGGPWYHGTIAVPMYHHGCAHSRLAAWAAEGGGAAV